MQIASLATIAALLASAPVALAARAPRTPARHHGHASPTVFVAVLDGAYEMPSDLSRATGTAEFVAEGPTLYYQVHADSLADVTNVAIHIGDAREQEPPVAWLFQGDRAGAVSGLLVAGTLDEPALHGTSMRDLLRALRRDDVYVTIATRSHPAGEVRGQLRVQPVGAGR
jgi:hypothetical protein